jgi:ATP-dependent Lhr-like helicase
VESIAGDVFQLGNTSYRILRVEPARCGSRMPRASRRPFRSGSAKHRRSDELSPRWRACKPISMNCWRHPGNLRPCIDWLIAPSAWRRSAEQLLDYRAAHAVLGALPSQTRW